MNKAAISVTLDPDNLRWLRGRAAAEGLRSVSEFLNRLVTAARTRGHSSGRRSVVGSIEIAPEDPALDTADQLIRGLFAASLGREMAVRESGPVYGARGKGKRARRA
jgi:hypothetical protein